MSNLSQSPSPHETKISEQEVPTSLQFLLSAMVVLAMLNTTWASIGGLDELLDAVGWDRLYGEEGDGEASTLGPSSHGTSGGGGSAASVVGAGPRVATNDVTRSDIRRYSTVVDRENGLPRAISRCPAVCQVRRALPCVAYRLSCSLLWGGGMG